jgi:hypothetical protein
VVVAIVVGSLIAACGYTSPTASASPSPSVAASPSVVTSPAAASPTPMSVAAANAEIRSMVSGAHPLLLPTTISSTWSALVTELAPAFFDILYTSPDLTQTIEFAIVVPNPGPLGANGSQSQPNFHGDKHSLYQVNDKTQPTSDRWMIWNEPGTWAMPNGLPGVPYFLTTNGLTDSEFWTVANAIR